MTNLQPRLITSVIRPNKHISERSLNMRTGSHRLYVDNPSWGGLVNGANPFTQSFWYKKTSNSSYIIPYYDYVSGGVYYYWVGTTFYVLFIGPNFSSYTYSIYQVPYTVNTWEHLSISYQGGLNSGNVKFYQNGIDLNLTPTTSFGTLNEPTPNNPRKYIIYGGSFVYLDEIVLFNKALTENEAQEIYNNAKTMDMFKSSLKSNILGWYSFDVDKHTLPICQDMANEENATFTSSVLITDFINDTKL